MKNELLPEVAAKYALKKGYQATAIETKPFGHYKTRMKVDLRTVNLARIEYLLKLGAELPLKLLPEKKKASKDAKDHE